MTTAKNSEKYRKKMKKEGFKSRQYFLPYDTIKAINDLADKTGMEKTLIITKAVEKLIESDYQGEVDTEATAQKRKLNTLSKNLNNFMKVFFLTRFNQSEITEMSTYLKEKSRDKIIILRKFYRNLQDVPINFSTYEEYRIFVIAFVDEDQ